MMWQKLIPQPRKLKIEVGTHGSELTLTEALAGRAGRLVLGSPQIGLWTPTLDIAPEGPAEYVCDLRFFPLSKGTTAAKFRQATSGLFLPATFVLFRGDNKAKIKEALEIFDFVIVPSHRIRNVAPFTSRVLGYTPPRRAYATAPILADI